MMMSIRRMYPSKEGTNSNKKRRRKETRREGGEERLENRGERGVRGEERRGEGILSSSQPLHRSCGSQITH